MRFVSRFMDRAPFEGLNARIYAQRAKALSERAEAKLQSRLVSSERLMYNYDTSGILDAVTGKLFTGKFAIPADKFERIVHVHEGMPVANLVRTKGGKNYHFELVGHDSKIFKINMPSEEIQAQTEKMLEADNAVFQKMADRFESKVGRTE